MYDLGNNCAGASAATDLKMSLSVTEILNNTETKFHWHNFILYALSHYNISYFLCSPPCTCHKVPISHLSYYKYSHGAAW